MSEAGIAPTADPRTELPGGDTPITIAVIMIGDYIEALLDPNITDRACYSERLGCSADHIPAFFVVLICFATAVAMCEQVRLRTQDGEGDIFETSEALVA